MNCSMRGAIVTARLNDDTLELKLQVSLNIITKGLRMRFAPSTRQLHYSSDWSRLGRN
jgi:hypothetical protein